jgi:hypothetical protein
MFDPPHGASGGASAASVRAAAHVQPYVVAAGDIACGDPSRNYPDPPGAFVRDPDSCHEDATAAMFAPGGRLAGPGLQGVLALGDLQYEYGRASEFTYVNRRCSIVPGFEDGPCSFAASWGTALRAWRAYGMPAPRLYPTPGNHEYQPNGGTCLLEADEASACGYNAYFGDRVAVPPRGRDADGAGSYAFRFDVASAHPMLFISLNVGQCDRDVAACARGSRLVRFLRRVLLSPRLNPPAGCAVVYYHQAAWDRYLHGNLRYVTPVWRAMIGIGLPQRPDLVVNGHNHLYERYEPLDANGEAGTGEPAIPQITIGTGGKQVGWRPSRLPLDRTAPPAEADLSHFGVERIAWSAQRGRIEASLYREGDRTPFDPVTYRCHGAGLDARG